jgi:CHASE1-domain containing sensor protein
MSLLALVLFVFLGFAAQELEQQSAPPSQSSTATQQKSTAQDAASSISPNPNQQPAASQDGHAAQTAPQVL